MLCIMLFTFIDLVPDDDFLLSGCELRDHRETLIEGVVFSRVE
jgi:hypothetical protein